MPPAALVIASAAATTFGVSAIGLASSSLFGLSLGWSFAIRAGVGLALGYLSSKNKPVTAEGGGYRVTATGSSLSHQIIYGRTKVSGVRVFDHVTGSDNKYLHRIIAFAGHEIDDFEAIYINDTKVNAVDGNGFVTSIIDETGAVNSTRYSSTVDPSLIRIKEHLGTVGQAADATLVSEVPGKWTTDHKLSNIAYLYVRFKYSENAYPNGVPEVSAIIKGKKVYDPRSGLTVWSDNPCLCLRDYLTEDYGLNAASGEIDDTLVQAGANACDVVVSSVKKYTTNGAFTLDSAPVDIIQTLVTSMAGTMWYSQGVWKMKPGYFTSSVLSLDEDDLRSGLNVSTRNSRRDNFNTVKGTFVGEESFWQPTSFAPVTDAAYITVDGGEESAIELDLPFCDTEKKARYVSNIMLRSNREQINVNARFGLRALAVEVGDTVSLTVDRLGWASKLFEVSAWSFAINEDMTISVDLSLSETSSAVYSVAVPASTFESNNTDLPDPFTASPPTGLTATNAAETAADGTYTNAIKVTWTAPTDGFVGKYDVEWKVSTDTVYSTARVSTTQFIIAPARDNKTYNIRVRSRSSIGGGNSSYATVNFSTVVDTTAPATPTGLIGFAVEKGIQLFWTNPTAADFKLTQVWYNTTNTTVGAIKLANVSGETYIDATYGEGGDLSYYFVRSADHSGNFSAYSSGYAVTAGGATDATNYVPDNEIFDRNAWTTLDSLSFSILPSNTTSSESDNMLQWAGALPIASTKIAESRRWKVKPGQVWYATGQVQGNGGTYNVDFWLRYYDKSGAFVANDTIANITYAVADSVIRTASGSATVPAGAYYCTYTFRVNSCSAAIRLYSPVAYQKVNSLTIEDNGVARTNVIVGAVSDKFDDDADGPFALEATGEEILRRTLPATPEGVIFKRGVSFEAKSTAARTTNVQLQTSKKDYSGDPAGAWTTIESWAITGTTYAIYRDSGNLCGPFEEFIYRLRADIQPTDSATFVLKNAHIVIQELVR